MLQFKDYRGNDRLDGGEGNDVLVGDHDIGPISDFGADNLKGGSGDDRLFQNGVGSEPQENQ